MVGHATCTVPSVCSSGFSSGMAEKMMHDACCARCNKWHRSFHAVEDQHLQTAQ